jgi:hypothetical protein
MLEKTKFEKKRVVLQQTLHEEIGDEYFELYKDESCLDGWFASKELRLIADKMDELKEIYERPTCQTR